MSSSSSDAYMANGDHTPYLEKLSRTGDSSVTLVDIEVGTELTGKGRGEDLLDLSDLDLDALSSEAAKLSHPLTDYEEEVGERSRKRRKTKRLVRVSTGRKVKEGPEYALVGKVLFGNYAILDVLGKGGMAVVYLAKHLSFDRLVALKTLNRLEPELTRRFSREADTHCKLKHRNIVSVYDKLALDNGRAFMVMEYVDGITLRELLAMDKQIERHRDIAEILYQICDALTFAHERGIIHRDLKPGNVALFEEDYSIKVKVLDFGLAKIWNANTRLTRAGQAVGSPDYMSPEQCYGRHLSNTSDIYSLGVVAYKMITGHLPYKGDSLAEIILAHKRTVPVGLYEYRYDLSDINELNAIIMKALSVDPSKRQQSAREFKEEVQRWHSMVTEDESMRAIIYDDKRRELKQSITRLKAIKNSPVNEMKSTGVLKKDDQYPVYIDEFHMEADARNVITSWMIRILYIALTAAIIFLAFKLLTI